MGYKKTSHTKWECNYHIVWITKYRYKVLVWSIANRLIELVRRISMENGVEIKRYWWKHFWAVWYFVRTSWNVTDEEIKAYVEKHKEKDDDLWFWEFVIK